MSDSNLNSLASRRLTEQKKAHFDLFGFVIFRGLPKAQVPTITEAFEQVIAAQSGIEHDGVKRTIVMHFAEQNPTLAPIIDIPVFDDLATHYCGEAYTYLGGHGNYYTGNTRWHPDSDLQLARTRRSLKIAFCLDRVDRDSVAFRVIPGSHLVEERSSQETPKRMKHLRPLAERTGLWQKMQE